MKMWSFFSWVISFPLFPNRVRRYFYKFFGMNLHSSAIIASGVFLGSSKITMKENTFINVGCFLDGSNNIILEKFVRVGPHVKILTGSHVYSNNVIRRGPDSVNFSKPVILEKGAWIGMGAIIMPGVVIREGCIVGAGAVVLTSTEANGLYAGNPARRIKDLPVE
jgi:maltose O-acetyltransferase